MSEWSYSRLSGEAEMTSIGGPEMASTPSPQMAATPPQDLDKFLSSCYLHWEQGGRAGVLARSAANFSLVFFVTFFSFVLLGLVDWVGVLVGCESEISCQNIKVFNGWNWGKIWNWLLLGYLTISCIYLFVLGNSLISAFTESEKVDVFFKLRLGISSESELLSLQWPEIVRRLSDTQNDPRQPPFCIVQPTLSELEISSIVNREDHMLMLLLKLIVTERPISSSTRSDSLIRSCVYSSAVLFNLRILLSTTLMNDRAKLRREFLTSPKSLIANLRSIGLANLFFLLPISLFAVFYFFLRDADDFRANRSSPVQKGWTLEAYWRLREWHECPLEISRRLDSGRQALCSLVEIGAGEGRVWGYLRKVAKFVCGSFAAVIVLLALYHEQALFHLHVGGRNLVWYLGVFGGAVALLGDGGKEDRTGGVSNLSPQTAAGILREAVDCMHSLPTTKTRSVFSTEPDSKAGFCEKFLALKEEISRFIFAPRLRMLAAELGGVVLAPYIFGVWLPEISDSITQGLLAGVGSTENLGDFVKCASPDNELFSSEEVVSGSLEIAESERLRSAAFIAKEFNASPEGSRLLEISTPINVFRWIEQKTKDSLLAHPWLLIE